MWYNVRTFPKILNLIRLQLAYVTWKKRQMENFWAFLFPNIWVGMKLGQIIREIFARVVESKSFIYHSNTSCAQIQGIFWLVSGLFIWRANKKNTNDNNMKWNHFLSVVCIKICDLWWIKYNSAAVKWKAWIRNEEYIYILWDLVIRKLNFGTSGAVEKIPTRSIMVSLNKQKKSSVQLTQTGILYIHVTADTIYQTKLQAKLMLKNVLLCLFSCRMRYKSVKKTNFFFS